MLASFRCRRSRELGRLSAVLSARVALGRPSPAPGDRPKHATTPVPRPGRVSGVAGDRAGRTGRLRGAAVLADTLAAAAPAANPKVLALAARAAECARKQGVLDGFRHLAVIDYSLPSTQPRLWVFDLERGRLMFQELVAHGRNTGEANAERFSNAEGSHMSSIGLFKTLRALLRQQRLLAAAARASIRVSTTTHSRVRS